MIQISGKTIRQAFNESCRKWPNKSFLCSPSTSEDNLIELSFKKVKKLVEYWSTILRESGYGSGQRVALLLGTNTDHYIFKLALNNIGISCVPINPDYTQSEIIYLLEDSSADLVITNKKFEEIISSQFYHQKVAQMCLYLKKNIKIFPDQKLFQLKKR